MAVQGRPVRYLHQEEPVHGEKPLTGMQRLHKKDPGSGNCGRSGNKNILHPHYTEGEGELQDGKDNKDHQQ